MNRGKKKATKQFRKSKGGTPGHGALMVVDGRPIRRKAKGEYEKVLRDLEETRRKIDSFQNEEKPRYLAWLHREFGPVLTELRETDRKVKERRQLLFEVEAEMFFCGISAFEAYQRVMARRQEAQAFAEEEDGFEEETGGEGSQGRENGRQGAPEEDGPDDFEEEFDSFFGKGKQMDLEEPAPSSNGKPPRVKELYRALVRRLHPDSQAEMTSQKMEWWHQVQTAYQENNVQQLEVILSLCEIEESGTTENTAVSLLMRIVSRLKSSLRKLKRELSGCRRDPAWNFTKLKDADLLAVKTRRNLETDLHMMQMDLNVIEQKLAQCARPPRRRRKQRDLFSELDDFFR